MLSQNKIDAYFYIDLKLLARLCLWRFRYSCDILARVWKHFKWLKLRSWKQSQLFTLEHTAFVYHLLHVVASCSFKEWSNAPISLRNISEHIFMDSFIAASAASKLLSSSESWSDKLYLRFCCSPLAFSFPSTFISSSLIDPTIDISYKSSMAILKLNPRRDPGKLSGKGTKGQIGWWREISATAGSVEQNEHSGKQEKCSVVQHLMSKHLWSQANFKQQQTTTHTKRGGQTIKTFSTQQMLCVVVPERLHLNEQRFCKKEKTRFVYVNFRAAARFLCLETQKRFPLGSPGACFPRKFLN